MHAAHTHASLERGYFAKWSTIIIMSIEQIGGSSDTITVTIM